MKIDWRDMFRRYMELVMRSEGVYFMDSPDWTEDEADALIQLHIEDGATPELAKLIVRGHYAK